MWQYHHIRKKKPNIFTLANKITECFTDTFAILNCAIIIQEIFHALSNWFHNDDAIILINRFFYYIIINFLERTFFHAETLFFLLFYYLHPWITVKTYRYFNFHVSMSNTNCEKRLCNVINFLCTHTHMYALDAQWKTQLTFIPNFILF